MAHSQNEKIDRKNFINGMKTFASYLVELSNLDEKAIQEGAKETQKVGKKLKSWRRRCKKDQTIMGCDCLECQ